MKTKQLLLTLMAVLLPLSSWAVIWQDPETKVKYTYTVGKNKASVKAGTSSNAGSPDVTGEIALLSSFTVDDNEYTVTSIGDYAFRNCSGLTSITIPNSVTTIGKQAFAGCSGLTSINVESGNTVYDSRNNCNAIIATETNQLFAGCMNTVIPNSVTSIGQYAFYGCSGLTSITIPNSVTSIGYQAFDGCRGLTSITIPNSVTSIGYQAFDGCRGLTSVTIPTSVKTISEQTFSFCERLKYVYISDLESWCNISFGGYEANPLQYGGHLFLNGEEITDLIIPSSIVNINDYCFEGGLFSTIKIPNTVKSIGKAAFQGCVNVEEIIIPNSVNSIGNYVFQGCRGLTSITIPNSVKSIGEGTFSGCSGLTYISIPNSVGSIGKEAFYQCTGLTSITMPNSVTTIGESAFSYCKRLTSITIPNSMEYIHKFAFSGCDKLTSVTSMIEKPFAIYQVFGSSNSLTLYVPTGAIESYKNTQGWEIFKIIEEYGDVWQDPDANVNYIYNQEKREAHVICSPNATGDIIINDIIIINGMDFCVNRIGDNSFQDCSGLFSVNIPPSVKSIGSCAFSGCNSLTSVTIPNSVMIIESTAFAGCRGLASVTIGDSVAEVGDNVFKNCKGLTDIIIGNSVISIGNSAFQNCIDLTKVSFPDHITTIGEMAFYGCKSLTSVTIPNSVSNIGNNAFTGCDGLTSVTINCPKVGEWFRDNMSIKELIIGEGVTSIGGSAFSGCSGLTAVTIPNSVTSIEGNAFRNCSGLTYFTIPTSVTSIGSSAFSGCSGLTSVDIPNSVTSIETSAFRGCSGLTSVTIPGSVTSIGESAFSGCSSLTSIISKIDSPQKINNNVFSGNIYNSATLYVPFGTIDAYKATYAWNQFKNIEEEYSVGSALVLYVTDEKNTDITDKASIVWYDADGKQIGTGKSLNGIEDGKELYYSVELNEELGRVYREVKMKKVVADGETITCQLEKIGRVMLEGRASATDIDKNTATVSVKQLLNGKWEQTYTTQTDEQGVFKVEVYDDETEITISGEGYLDATIRRDGFSGNGNVGTIPVNLISGFAIAANITLRKAGADETVAWTDGLNNIDFALTNKTKGKIITDFTVQNSSVIIKTGAAVGDEIRLTAKSKQGVFADASATFFIAEGANTIDLLLTELGGVEATCAGSSNGNTVGYLYNSDDMLAAKGNYVGETLSLRHIENGVYTLVSMGSSLLLGSMTCLADLAAVGLSEGADYVATRVEVNDGMLTTVSVSEVPQLDDTRFYYTNNSTYFSANKASVTAGNYLTLQAHVDFKPEYADKVSNVTLTIDLPEGCEMVENSVIVNRQAVVHTVNGNRVTMTLTQEQYGSQVRFCIIPTLNQDYTVTAMASFNINGQVNQPIGTAQFEAKGLSLSTIDKTANTNITINGTAKGHSEVSIYDNDVLIGKTSSKADGSWTAQCELYKPYNHSFHDIYAKIITENGMELTSETKLVEYDKNMIVPKKVTMLYNSSKTEYNMLQGTTNPSYYTYVPSIHDFTFLADFTRNDSTVIKNVNIKVLNSDGTVRTLPATFDSKQNKWVATTKYSSSSRLPKNVAVDFIAMGDYDYTEAHQNEIQDIVNQLENCYNKSYSESDASIVEVNDNDFSYYYKSEESADPILCKVKLLDFEVVVQMMKEKQFYYAPEESQAYYYEETENTASSIFVDMDNDLAFELTMSIDELKSSRRRVLPIAVIGYAGLAWKGYQIFDNIKPYWDHIQRTRFSYALLQTAEMRLQNAKSCIDRLRNLKNAKCSDGNNALSNNMMNALQLDIDRLTNKYNETVKRTSEFLHSHNRDLLIMAGLTVGQSALSYFSGKKIDGIVSNSNLANSKYWSWLQRFVPQYYKKDVQQRMVNSFLSNAMGWAYDKVVGRIIDLEQSYENVENDFLKYIGDFELEIYNETSLLENIAKQASQCPKDKEKEDENEEEKKDEPCDEKSDNNNDFKGNGSTPNIDPSGYVYEAVLSNRLEGVTATCYQKVTGEDMYGDVTEEAVVWNAADYSQVNPQLTDATGFYRWDVPQGMWQVKYEKDGYETAYSDWLPVPPPQLDVNIGMKQSTPPTVTQMRGYESGITIETSKYMRPATMTATNITVTRNGAAEKGSIEQLNAEQAPLGSETYVSKVKFVPQTPFNTTDVVVVTVHKEVESYCGVKMSKDHMETVKIEPEVKSIVADEQLTVAYQGTKELRVKVLPKEASAGKTLNVKTSSEMIVSVSKTEVTIGQDGTATLTVGGELPGGAVIDFSVEGVDVTATSKVQVVIGGDMVATPMASIRSGEVVSKGTKVELSCATEGATIYYTLDGSCPCDNISTSTRRIYNGTPITINATTTIKAMATAKGMTESDVATFVYVVEDPTAADEVMMDGQITLSPLPVRDRLQVTAGGKTIKGVTVSAMNGAQVLSSVSVGTKVTLDMGKIPSGVYMVTVTTDDATCSRKILKVE